MTGENTAVYGIYNNRAEVEDAIDRMIANGFRREDISVLLPDNRGTKDFAHEKHTKAPEGTATGAVTGGAVGGTLGLLAGIGALAIPGVGPLIAAGPIVATLAGVGAGGTVGGLVGALIGAGIPEYEAKRYEGRIRAGGILLSVHCDNSDWVKRAKDMLRITGAEDISSSGESKADFDKSDKPRPRPRSADVELGAREAETRRMAAGSSYPAGEYDADYRRDFDARYAALGYSYNEYEPAYRYGAVLGSDERYRGRDWPVIETDARRDWERTGRGRWEDYADAIRYGWSRASQRR